MAWEQRGSRKYFYTSERKNGKVIKTYFPDVEGKEQAKLVEQRHAERKMKQISKKAKLEQQQQADEALAELSELVGLKILALAICHHLHLHRGEWRQFRER